MEQFSIVVSTNVHVTDATAHEVGQEVAALVRRRTSNPSIEVTVEVVRKTKRARKP